jgi:4'-phosphopantetheinyl transferase
MSYELFFYETDDKNYPPDTDTLNSISPIYAEKYLASKNTQIKKNAIASGILLRDHLDIISDSQLSSYRGFFSLSHSNDCTVLAISKSPIGVDIEQLSTPPAAIVEKIFPKEFRKEYELAADAEKTLVFYRLWTKMEAHLKAEGTGFMKDPRMETIRWNKYMYETLMYKDYCITVAFH